VAPPHRGHPGGGRARAAVHGGYGPRVVADEKTVDAVLCCNGVIGEAARHVPDDIVAANPDLPWPEMRAMRNVIVREYFGVTRETLWKTAREDLPALVERLRQLLGAP
jgi:uncharacterized protein with HEPN domain